MFSPTRSPTPNAYMNMQYRCVHSKLIYGRWTIFKSYSDSKTLNSGGDMSKNAIMIAPSVDGCTLATAHTPGTNTHLLPMPEARHDVPTEPLMNVAHKKDKMNGRNKKFYHKKIKMRKENKINDIRNTYVHAHTRKTGDYPTQKNGNEKC